MPRDFRCRLLHDLGVPSITLESPAKLNLHLRVGPLDESGFHPLRSWMVIANGLYDTLQIETSPAGGIELHCDDPSIPTDARNLVWKAAHAIAADASLVIRLEKRIPAGAGVGGGSGNAATAIRAINQLLELHYPDERLREIAATIGSDVPFFIGGRSAIATGRGEQLLSCPAPRIATDALLIFPPFGISTPAAYRELDRLRPAVSASVLTSFAVDTWSDFPAARLLPLLQNDLEQAAFSIEPRLAQLRQDLEMRLERPVRMSGSGSTLFTLYDRTDDATPSPLIPSHIQRHAKQLAGDGFQIAVCTLS